MNDYIATNRACQILTRALRTSISTLYNISMVLGSLCCGTAVVLQIADRIKSSDILPANILGIDKGINLKVLFISMMLFSNIVALWIFRLTKMFIGGKNITISVRRYKSEQK